MAVFIFSFIIICFSYYNIGWLLVSPETLLLQTLTTYYLYRVALIKNLYQLIGYATLTLSLFASYLFFLQFDVFACFLLVSESIVMLFALSILMHLNYTNLETLNKPHQTWIFIAIVVSYPLLKVTDSFTYWVDWYSSQSSQYNDLLPQYIYFYLIDAPVVVLVGLWLLVLTLLLVQLMLSISFSRSNLSTNLSYTRKTQNIWTQWYKKPILRFFRK